MNLKEKSNILIVKLFKKSLLCYNRINILIGQKGAINEKI